MHSVLFHPDRIYKHSNESHSLDQMPLLAHANILEPQRPTVLSLQPRLPGVELPRLTSVALGRVRAVVERHVVVPDILEPMYLARILEQAQGNGMHRRIAPALVEEAPRPIQVAEVILVGLRAPETHVGDLEVRPEVAGAVAVRLHIDVGASLVVDEPVHRVVLGEMFGVGCQKFDRFGPQARDGLGRVEQVDVEAVCLVVVLHVPEDVVVDVAEELDFRLHAPVVLDVLEGRVAVEHAAIPPAHLVVGHLARVLHFVLGENFSRLFVELFADPRGHFPVVFGDNVVVALRLGDCLGPALEFFGELDIVEEGPGIVELVVPCCFQFFHRGDELVEFFVAHQGEEGGVYAG